MMFSWNSASENIAIAVTTILNEGKQQDFECNSKKHARQSESTR